jgi:hypothetical protein
MKFYECTLVTLIFMEPEAFLRAVLVVIDLVGEH